MARAVRLKGTKHWTKGEAKKAVDDFSASGLGLMDFCRQRGIHPARLRRWRERLLGKEASPSLPVFLPVSMRQDATPTPPLHDPIEVVVGDGWVVRVPGGCSTDALRSVFAALQEVAPC